MADPKPLPDRLSSWLKLVLLAALPVYFVVDLALANMNSRYYAAEQSRREDLCVRTVDAAGRVVLAEETERRREQPVSALGKLHLFLTCADMTKVEALGFEVAVQEHTRLVRNQAVAEATAPIQARIAELERQAQDLFGPETVEQVQLEKLTDQIRQDVKAQVAMTEAVVSGVELTAIPKADQKGNWVIVAGADTTRDAAITQVRKVSEILAEYSVETAGVRLMERGAFLRTVVVFDSRDAARQALSVIEPDLAYGGYVRSVNDWCPNPEPGAVVGDDIPLLLCGEVSARAEGPTPTEPG